MQDKRNQNNNYPVVPNNASPPSDDEARDDIENETVSQQPFKRLKSSLFFTNPIKNPNRASSSVAIENGQRDLVQQTSDP